MKFLPFNSSFLIAATIFAIAPFALSWYLYQSIQSERVHLEEMSKKAKVLTEEGDRLLAVRTQLKDSEGDRKKLDEYFVTENTIPDFLTLIESLNVSSTTKIEIRDVAVSESSSKASIAERLRFTVLVTGSFASVVHGVELVEALPYDLTIEQLALDKTGDEIGWRASITASVSKLKK